MEKIVMTNEAGNKITIKCKPINGIVQNYKTKEKMKCNGVSVQMIGPSSMSENNITYEEAIQLHKVLSRFLNK